MGTTTSAGRLGEDWAVGFLKKQGYKILQRNFRSKFGEIDIAALDGKTLFFVEVKTRWSRKFGDPAEAVTKRKLEHLERAAQYFKLLNPKTPNLMRIDVVATDVDGDRVVNSRLIKNASG